MTAGEKFEMVERFAGLAFDIYGAIGNPLGAYTAVRDAQRLTTYMNSMRTHATTGRSIQLEASQDFRLRPLPVETLSSLFTEPDQTDALVKP